MVPYRGCRLPFFSSPLTQFFYPLNIFLIPVFKIKGYYSYIDHQAFTILGLSIFALGLYHWLQLLNKNTRAILFTVLVMSVSFKVTETMRFPNAVHTAAWYPWILYGITQIYKARSHSQCLKYSLLLVLFITCLCTAGYPYFVYYSAFLIGPYALLVVFKKPRETILGINDVNWKRSLTALCASGLVAGLLCLPYLLFMISLMESTHNRSGGSFNYSTSYIFNMEDSVGSLIYPPMSQMEGWYFFSITALLLICLSLFAPLLKHKTAGIPLDKSQTTMSTKILLVTWLLIISYISYGRSSYLFRLLWHIMPGFSNLRVWGRMNIILIPVLGWLISMAYDFFERSVFEKQKSKKTPLGPTVIISIIYILILGLQLFCYLTKKQDKYWNHLQYPWGNLRLHFLIMGFIAFIAILLFMRGGTFFSKHFKRPQTAMLLTLLAIASVEMWPAGAHTWTKRKSFQTPEKLQISPARIHARSFLYRRTNHNKTSLLQPVYATGLASSNWYFKRYVDFLEKTENEKQYREILLGFKNAQKVFFSESLRHDTIVSFLKDAFRHQDAGHLISYDGETLVWEITAPQDGYLSFIDNWDPHWKVFVDGHEEKIELLFGTFKSVHLNPGDHQVRFIYAPSLKNIFLDQTK